MTSKGKMIEEPVIIHKSAISEMVLRAAENYEARGKKETIGMLFGSIKHDVVFIKRAVHYAAHRRTRSQVSYYGPYLRKRRKDLSMQMRMKYIGLYHSHVEIAGKVSWGLSDVDKSDFLEDEGAIIDLLAAISASRLKEPRALKASVSALDQETNYYYVVRTYQKIGRKIRLILPHVTE